MAGHARTHLSLLELENGRVEAFPIIKSSGYPLLYEATLKTVARYKLVPGRLGARFVYMGVQVPVYYRLRKEIESEATQTK